MTSRLTRPASLVALTVLLLLVSTLAFRGLSDGLRERSFDLYQQVSPPVVPLDQVALVTIDEAALAQNGRWPWPRTLTARLVDTVAAQGAAAIGLDLLFPEADDPANDEALAGALEDAPSVLAMTLTADGLPLGVEPKAGFTFIGEVDENAHGYVGGVAPVAPLAQATRGLGIVRSFADADGHMRAVPLIWSAKGADGTVRHWPYFGAELLRVAQGDASFAVRIAGAGEDAMRVGQVTIPMGDGRLRFADPEASVLTVSAATLLDGNADERLRDRIVILAVDAAGLDRYHLTARGNLRLGAELHAIAISQMLAGIHLIAVPGGVALERLYTALAGLGLAGLFGWLWRRPVVVAGGALVLIALPLAVGFWQFAANGFLLDGLQPAGTLLAGAIAGGYGLYRQADQRRRTLQKQFSQFLSPEVVRQLAETDTEAALAVEDRDISVMLVDVRGFTAMAENLGGERIVEVVNHFFGIASEEIFARDGTIDKYMGDAVLAFWNAPLDQPDHADRALRCATAIVERVARDNGLLERRGLPAIEAVAIVESGRCSVGNMGTRERVDYTAIGPAVNLVSRLEKEAKARGLSVAAGPGLASRTSLKMRTVDVIDIRGFAEPVRLHVPS